MSTELVPAPEPAALPAPSALGRAEVEAAKAYAASRAPGTRRQRGVWIGA